MLHESKRIDTLGYVTGMRGKMGKAEDDYGMRMLGVQEEEGEE